MKKMFVWTVIIGLFLSIMIPGLCMASPSDDISIAGVSARYQNELTEESHVYLSAEESFDVPSGSYLIGLTPTVFDAGAVSEADALDRSFVQMRVQISDDEVLGIYNTALTWVWSEYYHAYQGYYVRTMNWTVDQDLQIKSFLWVKIGSEYVLDETWTNIVGEGDPIVHDDRIVSAEFTFGDDVIAGSDGGTININLYDQLSKIDVIGMYSNASMPVVYVSPSDCKLQVKLTSPSGKLIFDDWLYMADSWEIYDTDYHIGPFESFPFEQGWLSYSGTYIVSLDFYTYDPDLSNYVLNDHWTVFLYTSVNWGGASQEGDMIFMSLGFIGLLGFVATPMVGIWLVRGGMESYRAIPMLMMGMITFGVLAYVFFLGGS